MHLRVNLPDHRPLPPRHPPVPRGPALSEPGLRTVLVEGIFDVITTQNDPTVALIRAASRSRSHIFLSRSQCPSFAGTQATFQARWVKGRPVFVREVVDG